MTFPMRQSLLQNNGDGTFSDVTRQAGLLGPMSSTHSSWADFDNDGWLDVYVLGGTSDQPPLSQPGERDVRKRQFQGRGRGRWISRCKGTDWIDYDNDDYPDLFINYLQGDARLYHNNRDGTFSDVTKSTGINGPKLDFPAGPGTTTMTAGSTSSPPATTIRSAT